MAKKKLILEQTHNPKYDLGTRTGDRYIYVVRKVNGSTTPSIYDTLTKAQVDIYCDYEDWEVTIS